MGKTYSSNIIEGCPEFILNRSRPEALTREIYGKRLYYAQRD
jgi:hypothetical protein